MRRASGNGAPPLNERSGRMRRSTALVVCLLFAAPAFAEVKPEEAIKLRRAALKLMGYYFSDLSDMAKGKKPYDRERAMRCASSLEELTKMPYEFFLPGTDRGDTKAKSEIWQDTDKWNKARDAAVNEVTKLTHSVKGTDSAAFKQQVHATAQACKACHDDFLAK